MFMGFSFYKIVCKFPFLFTVNENEELKDMKIRFTLMKDNIFENIFRIK